MRQRTSPNLVHISSYLLLLALILPTGNAKAADETAGVLYDRYDRPEGWAGDDSPLRLDLVIPLWLPYLALETTIESTSTLEVDTASEVSWVVIGTLEAGYRSLAARVDAFGIGFEDTVLRENGDETDIVVESSGFVGRGIVMYEFGPWRLKRNKPRWQFAVSPLGGARYNRVALGTGERTDVEGAYDWVDPLVGTRLELRLGDWRMGTHVDVGGFGISSQFAFWAAASVEYMITSWFSTWLGWQHYQVLFEKTVSGEEQSLELLLTGPSAGMTFHIL